MLDRGLLAHSLRSPSEWEMLVQEEPTIPNSFAGLKLIIPPTMSIYLTYLHRLRFYRNDILWRVHNSHHLFNFSGDFGFLGGLCLDILKANKKKKNEINKKTRENPYM